MDVFKEIEVRLLVVRVEDGVSAERVLKQTWKCSFPPESIVKRLAAVLERTEL